MLASEISQVNEIKDIWIEKENLKLLFTSVNVLYIENFEEYILKNQLFELINDLSKFLR